MVYAKFIQLKRHLELLNSTSTELQQNKFPP